MYVEEKFRQKLLVEGNDDRHVVLNLCQHFKLKETFDVIDCESDSKLLNQIPTRLKTSIQTLGIVIDADVNIASRWQQLRELLQKSGYNLPITFSNKGLIFRNEGFITIGIWIMPDNDTNGMLEDFLKFLIPSEDKLMPIAIDITKKIEEQGLNPYSLVHKQKAQIHTWLAWQEKPGIPFGQAIKAKCLNPETEISQIFATWLNELFNS